MSLLRSIETRIAGLVEGAFAGAFRTSVQPVELARRLVKEMDEHQQRTVRSVYVPNRYDVYLSRDDFKQLSPHAAALTSELSEYLAEHARRNEYALVTRPRVHLHLDRDLGLGRFGIAVRIEQPSVVEDEDLAVAPRPAEMPVSPLAADTGIVSDDELIAPSQGTQIIVGACALIGSGPPQPLTGLHVRVGRGSANDVVLTDASVSREHAELRRSTEQDPWTVRDLDSTNGVRVNGASVGRDAVRVSPGDEVAFGTVALRIERWPEASDA